MVTFLKKNIIFFIVFAVIMLASLFLLFLDVTMYSEISELNTQTDNANRTLNDYRKKQDKPVETNVKAFDEDKENLLKRTVQIRRYFGAPYRKFLLEFAEECGIDESTLLAEFKKHFDEYKVKISAENESSLADILNRPPHTVSDRIFFEFMDKYREGLALILTRRNAEAKKNNNDGEEKEIVKADAKDLQKINTAYRHFFDNILKDPLFTVENLVPSDPLLKRRTEEDIFACALGLPRTKPQLLSQSYLGEMQRAFVSKQLFPGVKDLETVRNFTYKDYVTQPPAFQAIPEIMLAMPVYEDIARRLRSVENLILTDMSKTNPAPTNGNDKYLSYRFKIKVTCTMDGLRDLVNKLHGAYTDNRVYIVRWVSVTGTSEDELGELKKILESSEGSTAPATARRRNYRSRNRTRSAEQSAISPYLDSLNLKYASRVVGKQKEISAEIDFDYCIYVGERVYSYPVNQQ